MKNLNLQVKEMEVRLDTMADHMYELYKMANIFQRVAEENGVSFIFDHKKVANKVHHYGGKRESFGILVIPDICIYSKGYKDLTVVAHPISDGKTISLWNYSINIGSKYSIKGEVNTQIKNAFMLINELVVYHKESQDKSNISRNRPYVFHRATKGLYSFEDLNALFSKGTVSLLNKFKKSNVSIEENTSGGFDVNSTLLSFGPKSLEDYSITWDLNLGGNQISLYGLEGEKLFSIVTALKEGIILRDYLKKNYMILPQ